LREYKTPKKKKTIYNFSFGKKTNQRNPPYNTTYVSEPPEKLQRTFMGDF
jgi:hypothetical protein